MNEKMVDDRADWNIRKRTKKDLGGVVKEDIEKSNCPTYRSPANRTFHHGKSAIVTTPRSNRITHIIEAKT